jgi:hypothetical protein
VEFCVLLFKKSKSHHEEMDAPRGTICTGIKFYKRAFSLSFCGVLNKKNKAEISYPIIELKLDKLGPLAPR